jgi:alginate O-acetyltransferase complex protein AlgJ
LKVQKDRSKYLTMPKFMKSARFKKYKPRFVVFSQLELTMPRIINSRIDPESTNINHDDEPLENGLLLKLVVLRDRFYKSTMINFIKARLTLNSELNNLSIMNGYMFLYVKEAFTYIPGSTIEEIVKTLLNYKKAVEKQNAKFIFLPIPNRENYYHEFFGEKSDFLARLILQATKQGIITVDTQKAFDEAKHKKLDLYQKDDMHLNKEGMALVSDLLSNKILNLENEGSK